MGTRAITIISGLVGAWAATVAPAASAQEGAKAHIVLHADATLGPVSPLIFGASYRWAPGASGSADPATGLVYPAAVAQISDVGIAMIRYPAGTLANMFQWQRAIGPRERRGQQLSGLVTDPTPLASGFGPDEFGNLLEQSGAVGDLTVNFATASAADAANFLSYMASPIGAALVNGVDWPARRAANKHPKPYTIAYVGVGHEFQSMAAPIIDQNHWIMGEPTSINAACAADKIACLYAFGGATRFEHQSAVQPTDWREAASISGGEPHLFMYARYAPVAAGSETVWVDGVAWQGLSDLDSATADARVYRINYQSGAVSFGDGVHGAIPPKGSKISVSYTSGPHEGFVDYYRLLKAINPKVKICASIHDESFIRIMGAQHRYDCIEQQPNMGSNPSAQALNGPLESYFVQMAAGTTNLGSEVQHTQQLIKKYAGANAAKVEMVLTDYGQAGTGPAIAPHFGRSEGQAVLTALALRQWVLAGVAAATRMSLSEDTFRPVPAAQSADSGAARDYALFAGPGPDTIVAPSALAIRILRQNTGDTLLASSVEGSPRLSSSKSDSMDALQVYATRDPLGNAYLVVINVDPQHDIAATVEPAGLSYEPSAKVATLASGNLIDENNPSNPQLVAIKESTIAVGKGAFELSFPKHSVTAIKLNAGQ